MGAVAHNQGRWPAAARFFLFDPRIPQIWQILGLLYPCLSALSADSARIVVVNDYAATVSSCGFVASSSTTTRPDVPSTLIRWPSAIRVVAWWTPTTAGM